MAPGLGLCARCILPCKNSRLLHLCCIIQPFSYLERWLPYIQTIVLEKLIYVMKVVQHLFPLQTSLSYFESGWQAWYYSYSSIHAYISQCGSRLSLLGSLVPKWHLLPHIARAEFHLWGQLDMDLLASSCTNQWKLFHLRKVHYLWRPCNWTFLATIGHIRLVMWFLFQL